MRWARLLGAAIVATVVLTGCGDDSSGSAETPDSSPTLGSATATNLTVTRAWAAATLPMAESRTGDDDPARQLMTVGYAQIENTGERDDRLVGASSNAARDVQLHETIDTGQSAGTMKPVRRIAVPAGATVRLRPGGYHLMIMGLRHQLDPGSSVPVRLDFASGARLRIELPVIDRADRPELDSS